MSAANSEGMDSVSFTEIQDVQPPSKQDHVGIPLWKPKSQKEKGVTNNSIYGWGYTWISLHCRYDNPSPPYHFISSQLFK